MRRNTLILLIVFILSLLIAACTDDEPADISGCEQPEGVSAEEAYTNDSGCVYGIKEVHAEEGEHGEESEGEHTEEGTESEAEGDSPVEAEAEPTQETTESAD